MCWTGSYYLEAGGPAGARQLVVDSAQLGVDLEADVAHNLHTAEQHITCIVWVSGTRTWSRESSAPLPPSPLRARKGIVYKKN